MRVHWIWLSIAFFVGYWLSYVVELIFIGV